MQRDHVAALREGEPTMADQQAAVWFVAEQREGEISPVTLGLAAEARRIAQALRSRVAAVLLGADVARLAHRVPADILYLGEHPALAGHAPEAAAVVLDEAVRRGRPSVLLLAATPTSSALAARLAARLGAGLASGCLRLDVDSSGVLRMLRPAYGGRASCTVACPSRRPQIATLLPQSLPAAASGPAMEPEVLPVDVCREKFPPATVVQGIERPPPSAMDVAEAEVLVAGGRGVVGPREFQHLEELSRLLGGTIAASRPAVDSGWAPASRQVGSSGKMVAPRLYIACGISGASQHVVGMRDSATIVVVNQDPYAPLVKMADVALIGDLREIIPAIIVRLRSAAEAPEGLELAESPPQAAAGPRADPLRIVACLSLCLDPERPMDLKRDAQGGHRVLNPPDAHALEEALALKDGLPGSQVTALSLGPPEVEAVLRDALALGSDRAVHLWDDSFVGSDSLASARILAAAIRRIGADAVLCGARNSDGDTGQLPLQLAEVLGWPGLTRVVSLSFDSEGATVRCRWQGGQRIVYRAALPALFAVEGGINRPRYAPVRRRLEAIQRRVVRWGLEDLGLQPSQVGEAGSALRVLGVGPPKPVSKGLFAPDDSLSAEERLQQLLGGAADSAGQRRENVLEGSPEYLAEQMVKFLLHHGFVRERKVG